MFAGKSSLLDKLITAADTDGLPWVALRPAADTRSPRFAWEAQAVRVGDPHLLRELLSGGHRHVFADEAQFFPPTCAEIIAEAAIGRGMEITVAGLNLDWRGLPWPTMSALMCYANQVIVLRSICGWCGGVATRSCRTAGGGVLVVPGGAESYQPACGTCWLRERTLLV
jgi:thymidine kinase